MIQGLSAYYTSHPRICHYCLTTFYLCHNTVIDDKRTFEQALLSNLFSKCRLVLTRRWTPSKILTYRWKVHFRVGVRWLSRAPGLWSVAWPSFSAPKENAAGDLQKYVIVVWFNDVGYEICFFFLQCVSDTFYAIIVASVANFDSSQAISIHTRPGRNSTVSSVFRRFERQTADEIFLASVESPTSDGPNFLMRIRRTA